jgi:hypothetical protein
VLASGNHDFRIKARNATAACFSACAFIDRGTEYGFRISESRSSRIGNMSGPAWATRKDDAYTVVQLHARDGVVTVFC